MAKKPNQIVVTKEEIGAQIKRLRLEQGLSQVELGKRLDMTQSNLSAIERGARGVTVHQVVRIAKALKASTDEILMPSKPQESRARRRRRKVMRQLQQIEELSDRDRRIIIDLLKGFLHKPKSTKVPA